MVLVDDAQREPATIPRLEQPVVGQVVQLLPVQRVEGPEIDGRRVLQVSCGSYSTAIIVGDEQAA